MNNRYGRDRRRDPSPTRTALTITVLAIGAGVGYVPWAHAGPGESSGPAERAPAVTGFERVWVLNGPESGETGDDMVLDALGNVLIAGSHGGIDIDRDGRIDVTADMIDPLFVMIGAGEQSGWARGLRSPGYNVATGVAGDGLGGLLGVGYFETSLTSLEGTSVNARGERDGFIARLAPDGSVLWLRAAGGSGDDGFSSVVSDASGNAYAVGTAAGSFALEPGGPNFSARGTSGALIVSYDSNGGVRWSVAGTTAGTVSGRHVALDPDGNVIVVGLADGPVDFDADGRSDLTAGPDLVWFVAKFDSQGAFTEGWSFAGPGHVRVRELEVTPEGDLLFAGRIAADGADLDGDGTPDLSRRPGDETNAFVARLTSGGRLLWARAYGLVDGYDVALDGSDLVLTGFYRGTRDIDEDGVAEPIAPDDERTSEIGLLSLSGEGEIVGGWTAMGPGNDQARAAVRLRDEPILYVTGFVQLTADFGEDGAEEDGWIRCDALGDLFVARYHVGGEVPTVEESEIVLSGRGRETEGEIIGDLSWTGAHSAEVDVYRNGELIATVANDGAHSHSVPRGTRGAFVYRVCEAGTSRCSGDVPLDFSRR